MAKYTITPWRHHRDLLTVRDQLYQLSKDKPDMRRHAVNRILAWKLRSNLPHAIESTALLIDAILHHQGEAPTSPTTTTTTTTNSPFSIRAVYTAAFTRFVTGFCDIGRNKERSLEPSSMLDIAKQIGMPVEFVALRHEAVHEEMPGIGRLVKVTERALAWLWEVYWSKLSEEGDGSGEGFRDEAKRVLKEFRVVRREALRAGRRGNSEDVVRRAAEGCGRLCAGGRERMRAFVEVLIQEKLLSPSKRELGASMDGAFMIWDPLLKEISGKQKRFVPALVRGMLEAISASSTTPAERDVDKEALSMWLIRIEIDEGWTASCSELEQHDLEVEIWKWCTLHANHWTTWLGQKMEEHIDLQVRPDWVEILKASRLDYAKAAEDEGPSELDPSVLSTVDNPTYPMPAAWSRAVIPSSAPIGVVR